MDDESGVSRNAVSRETSAPPVPEAARGVFHDRLELAQRYVAWLAGAGVERGLIGPREAPRLWERHVLNCAAVSVAVPEGAEVGDIGTGAGLPGLVLAIARPDVRVTLVEPLLRRTTFLEEVVADLGLDQVSVVRGRAETLHGGPGFDVVTSRAVAPLPRLLDWSMPLVRPRGALVAMKGASAAEEVREAAPRWQAWGTATPEVQVVEAVDGGAPTTLLRIAWADPSALSWPPAIPTTGDGSGRSGRGASGPRSGRGRTSSRKPSRQQRRSRDR